MPNSQAQVRWAHAVQEGYVKGDKSFANEVVSGMHGRRMSELPEHTGTAKRAKHADLIAGKGTKSK